MATSEGIPSSIDIEFLELNDNPYITYNFSLRKGSSNGDVQMKESVTVR